MPSPSTGSDATFHQINVWIDSCVLNHGNCGKDIDPTWKPTRLIDLGGDDTAGDPCLIESARHFTRSERTKSSASGGRLNSYITLSHCWGTLNILKLTEHNLTSLLERIPLNELPKTFRDAVQITKRLGIRYLWIDSLCIKQDSDPDWRAEAASMHLVYRNSHCNIAATGAEDGSYGCFFTRNPNVVNATQVRPHWNLARGKEFAVVPLNKEIREKLADSPLLKRAWVLQERILAPRVIHFTQEQVFFECHKYLACELYPQGIPDPHAYSCIKCLVRNNVDHAWIHRSITSEEEDYRGVPGAVIEWNQIVELYTGCGLTKPRDKLIALSGIATHFNRTRFPQTEYVAGLWRSYMLDALGWEAGQSCSRPAYRAPSWSWAALEGPITMGTTERWGGYMYCDLSEVWKAEATVVAENVFGQVTGGSLTIFGLTAQALFNQNELAVLFPWRSRESLRLTSFRSYDVGGGVAFDVSTDATTSVVPILFLHYRSPVEELGGKYDRGTHIRLLGLVLRKTEGGTYQRIGIFSIHGLDRHIGRILEFLKYPQSKVITII